VLAAFDNAAWPILMLRFGPPSGLSASSYSHFDS
jgi:hypothetical protein